MGWVIPMPMGSYDTLANFGFIYGHMICLEFIICHLFRSNMALSAAVALITFNQQICFIRHLKLLMGIRGALRANLAFKALKRSMGLVAGLLGLYDQRQACEGK